MLLRVPTSRRSRSGCLGLAAADVVAADAEADPALPTDHFVIFAQAAAATGTDGNCRTMAIRCARGYQASGDDLFAPAFSFNEGSHIVLLSAVMNFVVPRRAAPKRPCSGQEREEGNRNREMRLPGKRM